MLRVCVSRMTSSPLSGHLLVHTMSFVFCSLPAFLVCEYVLQYWSRCSRCPLQQRFPTQRSWLWRVDNCRKCIAHLFVTLGSLGSWGAFLLRCSVCWRYVFFFLPGVLSFLSDCPSGTYVRRPQWQEPSRGFPNARAAARNVYCAV